VIDPLARIDLLAHECEQLIEAAVIERYGRQSHGHTIAI
jgi:hypothetical protein